MSLIDRDYMNRDKDKKVKDSYYDPRKFRGDSNRQTGGGPSHIVDNENEKESVSTEIIKEENTGISVGWLIMVLVFLIAVFGVKSYLRTKENERLNEEARILKVEQEELAAKALVKKKEPYRSPYAGYVPSNTRYISPGTSSSGAQQDSQSKTGMTGNMVLKGGRDGHYFSSGSVNGFPVVFMVDTGATFVTISSDMAARAGISECRRAVFNSANGKAVGCKAMAERIVFGRYVISNVEVAISMDLPGGALIGMNVLRLFKIEQSDGSLTLSPT